MKKVTLSNGVSMNEIGFGTWKSPDSQVTIDAVKVALQCGYGHIDAAAIYGNEDMVGQGIRESGVKREDIFVTSKLWNEVRGYDETIAAFNKSLNDLGLEYLDLYLIHWPRPLTFRDNYIEKNAESWRAMEDLYKQGKVRAIGVSNFKEHHIEELMETATIKPMVNQIEFHPSLLQEDIVKYCKDNDIVLQAYSPLANGLVFKCEEILEMAKKYEVSPAQLCIKFVLQHGIVPITKSVTKERIEDNLKVDFEISKEDMDILNSITTCGRVGADSDNAKF